MKIPRLLSLEVPWQRLKVGSKQQGIAEEDPEENSEEDPEMHLGQLKRFSLRELQVATDNFSDRTVLGRGGFGTVYKGRLADGSLVEIKRLKIERRAGSEHQFQLVLEVSMAVHRNLLILRGFCRTQTEQLLVYPYMANGSVASCLRGIIARILGPQLSEADAH